MVEQSKTRGHTTSGGSSQQELWQGEEQKQDQGVQQTEGTLSESDTKEKAAANTTSARPSPSTFASSTIEFRIQLLPDDSHVDGRRFRNAISVNGKVLRITSLRTRQILALLATLATLSEEQILEHIAHLVTGYQEEIGTLQRQLATRSTAVSGKHGSTRKAAASQAQPTLLEAPSAVTGKTTSSGTVPPVSSSPTPAKKTPERAAPAKQPASTEQEIPEQLVLF